MTVVRIPGYCAGDDLSGEPANWLCLNTETKERWYEENPAYVPPPPPTAIELAEQEVYDLKSRLDEAEQYLASLQAEAT